MTTLVDTRGSDIEAEQLLRLNRLLRALVPGNRFYSDRLRRAGVAEGVSSLRNSQDESPLPTKTELVEDQLANPPFGSNLTYPIERYSRYSQTSGTKGAPLRRLDTSEDWGWMVDNWVRVLDAAGVSAEDRVYVAFSFGPFLGFWMAFESGSEDGGSCHPGWRAFQSRSLGHDLGSGSDGAHLHANLRDPLGTCGRERHIESGQTQIRTSS